MWLSKDKNLYWKYDKLNYEEFERKKSDLLSRKMYYVFHYPKMGDHLKGNLCYINKPRYSKMRSYLRIQSLNLAKLREESKLATRILGIDGCGNELICRPEAFGQAFRFLKKHFQVNGFNNIDMPKLRITYHVGEDFLDIIDGLRAVNEAILFLDMSECDRIGHGMVLGIDVEKWYYKKENRITITKQAFLDNISWIIHKLKICNIENIDKYMAYFQPIYNRMYSEIYGDVVVNKLYSSNNEEHLLGVNEIVSEDIYYLSMLLRGDDPRLYLNCEYRPHNNVKYWNRCAKSNACTDSVRNNKIIGLLYNLYNYNYDIKTRGEEIITINVTNIYIKAVKHIQCYMRDLIAQKGVAIETNPSSNYLIGTFKRYEEHPIIKFNSNNLSSVNDSSKEINVSINTDDQGVFNTYLENEYALMALSLEKSRDRDDKFIYDKQKIYRWIEEVRKMGLLQSFMENLSEYDNY